MSCWFVAMRDGRSVQILIRVLLLPLVCRIGGCDSFGAAQPPPVTITKGENNYEKQLVWQRRECGTHRVEGVGGPPGVGWQNTTAHRLKCEWELACTPQGLQEQVGFVQSRLNRLRRGSLIFKLSRYFSCLTVIGSDFRDMASSGVPEETQPSALLIPHCPAAMPALHQPPERGCNSLRCTNSFSHEKRVEFQTWNIEKQLSNIKMMRFFKLFLFIEISMLLFYILKDNWKREVLWNSDKSQGTADAGLCVQVCVVANVVPLRLQTSGSCISLQPCRAHMQNNPTNPGSPAYTHWAYVRVDFSPCMWVNERAREEKPNSLSLLHTEGLAGIFWQSRSTRTNN